MIKFSNYIKEEKVETKITTLHDIESGVFNGKDGVEKSLELISSYLEKHKDKIPEAQYTKIKSLSYRIKDLYASIPLGILNRAWINVRISGYIKSYDSKTIVSGQKVHNAVQHVIDLNDATTQRINKEIIHSIRSDVRVHREKEKNELIRFFKDNANTLVKMYELYNMFIDIKDAINERPQ